jgi:predicted metal-dependent peptidase
VAATFDLGAWLDAFLRDPAFLGRYPYYAAILGQMHPVADPSVQRMAVSLFEGRFFLHVNVDAFVAEPQYLRGVLLHEVHHVALGHLAHPKFLTPDEPELMDLALEMSANEYIEEPLPNPIRWKSYEPWGIKAGQSTLERYHRLVEARRPTATTVRARSGAGENGTERVDDHRFLRRRSRDRADGAVEHTRRLLQGALDEVRRSQGERAEEDPSRTLLAGRTPGRILEDLTGAKGPAEVFVDWKQALAMFVARARAPVHTWSRPSRRFPEQVGVVPGRTYAPRAIVRPSLLAVIDTSMSMTPMELDEVARQLAVLSQHARITIVECDAEITRTYPFAGTIENVAGRGGTDLRPVFDATFLGAQKADGVVYFTDGDGPFPEKAPPLPVLWVLTKPHDFRCPWGERAHLTRRAAPAQATAKKRARKS